MCQKNFRNDKVHIPSVLLVFHQQTMNMIIVVIIVNYGANTNTTQIIN